ncbi:MAG: bifunctional 2-C-methyl-D-erythritol 4-phosphate cytidylyltransferase/2-C-methyl-D-erythritol 2,4-cyclodiphosphate synthase [Rhodospirillales bacterium]
MTTCIALIVAAGRGHRFGGETPKQYLKLGGAAVLRHCLAVFLGHPRVGQAQVVIHPDDRALYDAAVAGLDLPPPVHGGAARQDSVRLGLESLEKRAPDLVLIHDAARPFVDAPIIDRTLDALSRSPGAIAAVKVADTIKRAGKDDAIAGTLDRAALWRAQTPQGFRFREILTAHRAAAGRGPKAAELTDDAAVAERAGLEVALVAGSEDNFKVTTMDDLSRAERVLAARGGGGETRVGTGFDVHRLGKKQDYVTLCGVRVPHDSGLIGHSDADVALHALTDAILGALGVGDIGSFFPPTDARWKDADSAVFIRHAADQVTARGGAIVHLDVTIVCERPRVGPHRAAMARRVGEILGLEPSRVSVKATTTEELGFTGRREGIAAQAVATIRLPG